MLCATLLQHIWPTQHQRSTATLVSVRRMVLSWTQRRLLGHLVRLPARETLLCSHQCGSRIWLQPPLRAQYMRQRQERRNSLAVRVPSIQMALVWSRKKF